MELSVFYAPEVLPDSQVYTMNEDTSKYCISVLRHETGDQVLLANGKGHKFSATITDDNRKRCQVKITGAETVAAPAHARRIAIAFTKNASRIEWFLEKATEIGIQTIIPLVSHRSEKEKIKQERLNSILVSAMLQSQQFYLPVLTAPQSFDQVIKSNTDAQQFIAHCLPEQKKSFLNAIDINQHTIILIGPEGDFTPEEVQVALQAGYIPVTLGENRLRTETAGVVAVTAMALAEEK